MKRAREEEDTNRFTRVWVTENSWYDIGRIPEHLATPEQFHMLMERQPETYDRIKLYGKEHPLPRKQQMYGHAYKFSNINLEATEPPEEMLVYQEYVNSLEYGEFGGFLMNWYLNGNHYISKHKDSERGLTGPIVSLSLGQTRVFRIRNDATGAKTDVEMPNGCVLIMGGDFQKELTHEVPKVAGAKGLGFGPRINMTFRQFN